MIEQIKEIANIIEQKRIEFNGDLRKVSQWSYAERTKNAAFPYFAIMQTVNKNNVVEIHCAPTSKQKKLKEFFEIKADFSKVCAKYHLEVTPEETLLTELTAPKTRTSINY